MLASRALRPIFALSDRRSSTCSADASAKFDKMIKKLFLAAFIQASVCSCSQVGYLIEGNSTIQAMDGKMLYLKAYKDDDLVDIDSSDVVHGKFGFVGELDSVMMVTLFLDDECVMPVVLGPERLSIHIAVARQYVTGSALNDTLYSFILKKNRLDNELAELPHKQARMIMDGIDENIISLRLSDEAKQLAVQNDRLVTNFISANFDNVLGAGIFMIMTSNYPYPVITPQIEEILSKATPYFKGDAYVRNYVRAACENMEQLGYSIDEQLRQEFGN